MKRFSMLLVLGCVMAAGLFAAELTNTFTTGVAQVINTGETVLFKVIPLGGDGAANTLATRSIVFYDNVSVRVSNHPHTDLTAFTWRFEPGQYCTDVQSLDMGIIHSKWGYTVIEGPTFTNGVVVSPTAGEKLLFQFKDK